MLNEILTGPLDITELELDEKLLISDDNVIALVKGLPKLEDLQVEIEYDLDWDKMRELRAFLCEKG